MKKRVKIPARNAKALLDLAMKMRAKHIADGEISPLKVLNWDEISPVIDDALDVEEQALKLKREKLRMYQQRAQRLEAVANIIRRGRDVLTGVHSAEMKVLGLWGFDVLDNRVNNPTEDEKKPENE